VRAKIKSADPKASAPLATTASESRLFQWRMRHRLHGYSLLMVKTATQTNRGRDDDCKGH
jgi:hypothetical protein